MNSTINIIISINDVVASKKLEKSFANNPLFKLFITDNAYDVMLFLAENEIDFVISSIELKNSNGVELLKFIAESYKTVNFIFYNNFKAENFSKVALSVGAIYCIDSTTNFNLLTDMIKTIYLSSEKSSIIKKINFKEVSNINNKSSLNNNSLNNNKLNPISEVLLESGFKSKWDGYAYLLTALELLEENISYLNTVTKTLYPKIAKIHSVNSKCVERAIRFSITRAYNDQKNNRFVEYFSINNTYNIHKPTNSELIGLLYNLKLKVGELK